MRTSILISWLCIWKPIFNENEIKFFTLIIVIATAMDVIEFLKYLSK